MNKELGRLFDLGGKLSIQGATALEQLKHREEEKLHIRILKEAHLRIRRGQ